MRDLLIYIVIFIIMICIVGSVNTYFYNNIKEIDSELFAGAEYTRVNLYFLKTVKYNGIKIKNYGLVEEDDSLSSYITFETSDGTTNTFIKVKDILYYNKIKLCENVEEFSVVVDKLGKETISIDLKISNKDYKLQYVIN